MPWQIPVMLILGFVCARSMRNMRRSLREASDARDYGSRMVDVQKRRMAKVHSIAAGVSGFLIVVLIVSALF